MQEELEKKTVVVITTGAKLTERLLKSHDPQGAGRNAAPNAEPKVYRGKQSVKHLLQQGGGASTIEVSSASIRTFERVREIRRWILRSERIARRKSRAISSSSRHGTPMR